MPGIGSGHPSRRTTATAAGLRNTTTSPLRIGAAPAAVSAVRPSLSNPIRAGLARSAARTATIGAWPNNSRNVAIFRLFVTEHDRQPGAITVRGRRQ